jgi:hypothetical protein
LANSALTQPADEPVDNSTTGMLFSITILKSPDGPVDNSSVSGKVLAVKFIDFFGAISRTFPSNRRTFTVEVPALINWIFIVVAGDFAATFAFAGA